MIRFLFQQSIPKRIAASFAIVILVGSLLLDLPISQLETSHTNDLTKCIISRSDWLSK